MTKRTWIKLLGLTLIVALMLPVAGVMAQGGDDVEPLELPEVDPLGVTGDIAIAGSSTVEPVTIAMAARFNEDGFTGNIAVAETGTSAGFERFCTEGSTDVSNASRPIRDSEVEDCAALGRTVLEFLVGIDAIAVSVPEGSPITELKRSEMIQIFTGAVTEWGEVREDWADLGPISLFIPGTDSGTFEFFNEAIFGDEGMYETREARTDAALAGAPTTSENDFTLVEGIAGTEGAIGYFGFAYYVENEDSLDAVAIADDVVWDDDAGEYMVVAEDAWEDEGISFVAPTAESAFSGEYMLSRPLFIYTANEILQEKAQVAAFVNYYLTNATEVVAEVGYFPVSTEALNGSKQAWLDAMGME